MKFVDLKCPNCGGRLFPVQGNQKIVACEYCGSQYILEDNRVVHYHVHQHGASEGSRYKTADSSSGRSGALAAAGILLGLAVLFGAGIGISSRDKPDYNIGSRAAYSSHISEGQEAEEGIASPKSPFYEALVEGIYKKPSDTVDAQERDRLKYIKIHTGRDLFLVDYSFGDPYGSEAMDIRRLALAPEDWDTDDLANFPGLVKVELSYSWADGAVLQHLKNLKGLACHGASPKELAQWLDPGQLTELRLDQPGDLEGLSAFENLEILSLEDVTAPDIRQLASMKGLWSLSIIEDEPPSDPFSEEPSSYALTDYSAISVLAGLECLELESSAVRDVSFLKSLQNLKELSVAGTEAISLEPVGDLSRLTRLRLEDNSSVKDYGFLSGLTGITSLVLDKDTSQPDPDLSSMRQLKELEVCGLMSMAPLKGLAELKSLSIHGCNIDEIQALSSLSGLERLTCYSSWTYAVPLRSLSFVDGMTSLEYLDFCGIGNTDGWGGYGRNMEIYGDISNVFNHAGLKELYLNDCMFGLDFDRLAENPSLEILQMKEVSIKKNIHVESYSGMTDVWYDDVSLDENTGFLTHYPGLKELYLDGNQITDVSFAAGLKELERLGLCNNYVTDLTPLNQAGKLDWLDIRQNPVNGTIAAEDSVEILQ